MDDRERYQGKLPKNYWVSVPTEGSLRAYLHISKFDGVVKNLFIGTKLTRGFKSHISGWVLLQIYNIINGYCLAIVISIF